MHITGLYWGEKLLKYVNYPTSEVLGPEATNEKIKAITKMPQKRVHCFGKTKSGGSKEMMELLGGKGANLAEMTSIGLPVPSGFTITIELLEGLMEEVHKNMAIMEQETKKEFGSESNPQLVSVRSGAAVSMPGMMDTIIAEKPEYTD